MLQEKLGAAIARVLEHVPGRTLFGDLTLIEVDHLFCQPKRLRVALSEGV